MPTLTVSLAVANPVDLIVEVELAPLAAHLRAASRFRRPIGQSTYKTSLLVDTGTTRTTIDEVIATALHLPNRSVVSVTTKQSQGLSVQRLLRPAAMVMFDTSGSRINTLIPSMLVAVDPPGTYLSNGIGGLLGMDLLSLGTLTYDGPGKSCVITWPQWLNGAKFAVPQAKP